MVSTKRSPPRRKVIRGPATAGTQEAVRSSNDGSSDSAIAALVDHPVDESVRGGLACIVRSARELMEELAAQPRLAVRLAKILVNATARGEAGPEMERLAYTLAFYSPERAERMHRFLERRSKKTVT